MTLSALLFLFAGLTGPDSTPPAAEDAILAAFDSAWVVALGENHGHREFHELLLRVLRRPRAPEVIDDIAVEWGNGLYQGVIDRYVDGREVPWDSVTMSWRNTIVSPNTVWDAPVYERFFRELRAINAGLAPERRYRVILADAPVDWSAVDSAPQLRPFFDRALAMAESVRRESLLRGRRVLFVAGGLHVARRPRAQPSRSGVPTGEITPVAWLELRHPGATYVIQSFGSPSDPGARGLVGAGAPRVVPLRASPLGDIPANATSTLRDRDGKRPDVYGRATLRHIVDAVILWDPSARTFEDADPSTYRVEWYWAELDRRSLMLSGRRMDPALRRP
ncbi:MAG: hypothetical protein IPJ78_19235 [Gemmatimonadetes bacterium]|nr:hypothetical protein [Gemmatimonadota bacterium]